MVKVSPSILAADFSCLEKQIKEIEDYIDYIHLDVMDGHFVPNLSFGPVVAKYIQKITDVPLDVHLMVTNPMEHIEWFSQYSPKIISVHYEVCHNLYRIITRTKELESKAFVAINPHTPVLVLDDILEYVDGILVMSVNPGFSGQSFIERTYHKVEALSKVRENRKLNFEIMVDGGVSPSNAQKLVELGADILVMGSAVFKAEDPAAVCQKVRNIKVY